MHVYFTYYLLTYIYLYMNKDIEPRAFEKC